MERIPDTEDRRVVRVYLTDIGRETHKAIDKYVRQRVKQILSSLSEEERAKLIELVNKLVTTLKEVAR
jgi:DNA-binding MarR family transcriptional regulator